MCGMCGFLNIFIYVSINECYEFNTACTLISIILIEAAVPLNLTLSYWEFGTEFLSS